jgi:hypothetical protein
MGMAIRTKTTAMMLVIDGKYTIATKTIKMVRTHMKICLFLGDFISCASFLPGFPPGGASAAPENPHLP